MPILSGHPIHPVLVHKTALNKLEIRVLQSKLSDCNGINPEIYNRRIMGNSTHLEVNTLLDHLWVREEFSREISECGQLSTNENAVCEFVGCSERSACGKVCGITCLF